MVVFQTDHLKILCLLADPLAAHRGSPGVRRPQFENTAIMKGIDGVDTEHVFELDDDGGYDLRGHCLRVNVQRSRLQLEIGLTILQPKSCLCMEQTPSSVVEASSVNVFKNRQSVGVTQDVDFNARAFSSSTTSTIKLQTSKNKLSTYNQSH